MKPSKNIQSSAILDIGLCRQNNEDSYLSLPDYQLWAVADGMGGHEGGEIASAIAITTLKNATVQGESLVAAIELSHQAIELAGNDGVGNHGMGSTIVALKIQDNHYQIAWVGDSRAYLYRSELKCLSKDHSYIQLMLDQGLITEADAVDHPYRHTITQALGGIAKTIEVDVVEGELQQGDIFLLCSDGLSGEVSLESMQEILSLKNTTLPKKSQQLVNSALNYGGGDNIAVVLVEIS